MASLQVGDYHIGIVCALSVELAAIRAMLDEDDGVMMAQDNQDHNTYFTGKFHQHRVVVTSLPAGIDGTAAAATVANNMIRTFNHLRFSLLVGIGGGIPDLDVGVDIRLGDIVVNEPRDTHGGVVQHDKGKYLASGNWQQKGLLQRPPNVLLNALQAIRAQHEMYDSAIPRYLTQMQRAYPRMRETYAFPGAEHDILHNNKDYITTTGNDESVCLREPRLSNVPQIHYGTIVSGNQVIKDATIRDHMRRQYGAICVEMEAAGLMDRLPCLVIRGVCDYADRHKNDRWHRYAAATAAAFAKELLLYVSAQATSHERPIEQLLANLEQHFHQQDEHNKHQRAFQKRQEIRHLDHDRQACLQAFKTTDYESQKDVNSDAAPGTCKWVSGHPQYQRWFKSRGKDVLWISADPGCGKSVLSKLLVDSRLETAHGSPWASASLVESECQYLPPHTICYFFFKDTNEEQDNLATAFCALAHQLFSHQPDLLSHALPMFEKNGANLQKDISELWRILWSASCDAKAQPTICIIDALDECRYRDRRQLIRFLCQTYLSTEKQSKIKWLVTSRPYDDIQDHFDKILADMPSIRLRGEDETDQIRTEISLVIREQMIELSQELRLSDSKTREVTEQLLNIEHRTYLWLYLAIEEIRKSFRNALRASDQTIPLVPTTVEHAYERILQRVVDDTERKNARLILTIIVGAKRPLTLGEMALALDLATLPTIRSSGDLTIDVDNLGDNIRRWCGLFVRVVDNRLYLLHQTAKEFLLTYDDSAIGLGQGNWRHCLSFIEVEKQMARICVSFLHLSDFAQPDPKSTLWKWANRESTLRTFLSFVSRHWADHVRTVESHLEEDVWDSVRAIYNTSTSLFKFATAKVHVDFMLGSRRPLDDIQVAAYNGHGRVIRQILSVTPEKLDSNFNENGTALIWALFKGHVNVARTLLDMGADIHIMGSQHGSALQAASFSGQLPMVETLLDMGAKVDAQHSGRWPNALCAAASSGYTEIAKMLIDRGADINSANARENGTPLALSAQQGHLGMVQMLLDKGADIDPYDENCHGALHAALAGSRLDIAQTLLDRGADVYALDVDWGSTLYAAVFGGLANMVSMLLEKGISVKVLGGAMTSNASLLELAARKGHSEIVKILLSQAGWPDDRHNLYSRALEAAVSYNRRDAVIVLLEKIFEDPNVFNTVFYGAFQAAKAYNRLDMELLLYQYGARQPHT